MTVYLILIAIGMMGLMMMALPGFHHHHAHSPLGHGGHHGLGGHGPTGNAALSGQNHAALPGHHGAQAVQAVARTEMAEGGMAAPLPPAALVGFSRLIPSPPTVFSLLALTGAFGYVLGSFAHLALILSLLIALVPALLVERVVVAPLWGLLFRFEGKPSSPFLAIVTEQAEAVTPFHNGRGIVRCIRDGRVIQLSARLVESQAALPVKVGDTLRIQDVDESHERVVVSLE